MIYILYTSLPGESPACFESKLGQLPLLFREKILSLKRWEDRVASLYGKLLLMNGLRYLSIEPCLEDIKYSAFMRPYLITGPDFNITHSGNYAGLIISTCCTVGIDIEEMKELNFGDFADCFSGEEWQDIRASANPSREFFNYWTRKEAVIKADGKGLSLPLKSIDIRKDETVIGTRKWYIHHVPIDANYAMHFATDVAIDKANISIILERI